ncbi:MAG: polyprenyl diphosphate synthase [Candidatus Paceibacterota bacterium]|jgi:undecaprenyl diphosphate synthase
MKNLPKHVAIIPDGNRRWAKKNGLAIMFGHEKGAEALEEILNKTLELKIPYITFWGLSLDNVLKRSKPEIDYIYSIIEKQFKKLLIDKRIHENKIKVQAFGRWMDFFPKKTQQAIKEVIEKTKDYDKYYLNFLMAYNGTDEMLESVKSIQKQSKEVTEDLIKKNLWTKDLPSVDLIIRTGVDNDPHLSAGFMMWDAAYAQLYFTKIYFPDFTPEEFEKSLLDFADRQRRKGA